VSLYKRCACDGWRCEHPWWYRFRLNGHNYRSTTQTALKRQAHDIEAEERTRILEGRHGIRRQPDITFREFAKTYLSDHAELHKRSVERDRQIVGRPARTTRCFLPSPQIFGASGLRYLPGRRSRSRELSHCRPDAPALGMTSAEHTRPPIEA